ncbi:sensor domain-containing diguanylate cyclase [Phyllobacterium zundukense]|uniref:GGDEF domain-containing protein n=1 Tax=Phyllobacterium zundukense TaxID=1867719 RepID=A0A2N9VTN9_9HYPH|nr:sensor domain-containing diguanylate cyclase [Phyllobacterium zundukense]ATU93193.1 GGDEF domain-containing protein [Phyllobacterium zundukense]PIO42857.1 GGDEF domain-containing protein [Phyllobacterium zundukense]
MSDIRPHSLPAAKTRRLSDLAADVMSLIKRRRDGATVARMRAELEAKESVIREQTAALAHSRKIFDRSSAAARIGVWECSLPDETLQWTDVVYDIFDLPRGSPLDRSQIVRYYSEDSVKELHMRRSKAIEERSGFSMDAEIITAKGIRRWMRLTATVECEEDVPVRIFGMKQDITEQKILLDRTRYMADFDLMTGLANRSQFQSKLSMLCESHAERNRSGALLLVDLDGFKKVNDTLGHAVGDECLKEIANRLKEVCRDAEVVARIGGDEFAVFLGSHFDRGATANFAREIVEALSKPIDHCGQSLKLGASVGVALVDACTPSELFKKADIALYAAKAAGRNTFQIFESSHAGAAGKNALSPLI